MQQPQFDYGQLYGGMNMGFPMMNGKLVEWHVYLG